MRIWKPTRSGLLCILIKFLTHSQQPCHLCTWSRDWNSRCDSCVARRPGSRCWHCWRWWRWLRCRSWSAAVGVGPCATLRPHLGDTLFAARGLEAAARGFGIRFHLASMGHGNFEWSATNRLDVLGSSFSKESIKPKPENTTKRVQFSYACRSKGLVYTCVYIYIYIYIYIYTVYV